MDWTRRNLLASTAAASLVSGRAGAAPTRGGTLRMWTPEPVMLTGAFNSTGQIYMISGKMFDGLVEYDFDSRPQPKLARSWEGSLDGLSLTFHLRDGVTWHDGKPFTSADLQFSALKIWRELHPRGRATYRFLTDVETPDALTAIFRFSTPSPYVMNALAGVESQVLPRHLYEGTDILTNPANASPVGTGPFRFKQWRRGQFISLERNPNYWDSPRPYLNNIIFVIMPDAAARAVALEAGELDIAGALPVALVDAKRLASLPDLTIPAHGDEALAFQTFMEINLRRPYFQDVRVRQALYHALDRGYMLQNIYFGFGTPATGPISAAMAQFYSADVPQYPYNPDRANALLDEAGLKRGTDGVRLRITHDPLPIGDYYFRSADYFKQQMARVGIAVDIRSQDFPTYYKRVYTDYDFDTTSTGAFGLTDPTIGVQRFYWSKNITAGVPFSNGSGYNSAEVDAKLQAAQIETDVTKRRALFADFQRLVMQDLPILPIGDVRYITIKNRKVFDSEISPFGVHDSFAQVYLAA